MKAKAFAKIAQPSSSVAVARIELPSSSRWEGWILLRSDAHHDNAKCNRQLEKEHLDEAVRRNALIFDCGDLFCAMQGKFDPRSSKSALPPEMARRDDYLNALVEDATEFYRPYAGHWGGLSHGNHETSIINRCGVDLTKILAEKLDTCNLSYGGFIRLQFCRNRWQQSRVIAFHHGFGGGGPVTRGTIQTNRRAIWYPDADVVWSGHVHESWVMTLPRLRLTQANAVQRSNALHVCTPGYKDEHSCQSGWAVEKGLSPKPLGACWLRLVVRDDKVVIEAQQALG